jgi:hypothetical protein
LTTATAASGKIQDIMSRVRPDDMTDAELAAAIAIFRLAEPGSLAISPCCASSCERIAHMSPDNRRWLWFVAVVVAVDAVLGIVFAVNDFTDHQGGQQRWSDVVNGTGSP